METQILKSAASRLSSELEETRYTAVKDLSFIRSVGAVPLLIEAVADSSFRVREEALRGICGFSPEVIFPRLETCLRDNENANFRNAAMEAFPRYTTEATPFLLGLLKDFDEEIRTFAAVILGEIRDPNSVEGLIQALRDPDENVKHAAAECLGKIKDSRSVEPLIECLDGDFWLQYPAIIALGEVGDPRAVEPLLNRLGNEMLKQPIIEALGKIGDLSAIPPLASILLQEEPSIRDEAISALVNIQTNANRYIVAGSVCLPSIKQALNNDVLIAHLLASLNDSNQEVRKNAIIALGWLKEKRAAAPMIKLIGNFELEEYIVSSLISIGKEALPDLIQELSNPDPNVRASLARCIGWIDDAQGAVSLVILLNDYSSDVKCHAILAMSCAVELPDVEDALVSCISDRDVEVRQTLVEVLGKSGSASLTEKVFPYLSSDFTGARVAAIKILGRLKKAEAVKYLKIMLDDSSNEARAEACHSLNAILPRDVAADFLLRGILDSSPHVRRAAAGCLADCEIDKIGTNLQVLLKDPDPDVRICAVKVLGEIGADSCMRALIESYAIENKILKMTIIETMAEFKNKGSAQFLIELLKDADTDIKRETAISLGKLEDKRSVPHLVVALGDADWSVRVAAIQSLARIGDRRCVVYLLEKLDEEEDIVKKEAVIALGKLNATESLERILSLVDNENIQKEVIGAVETLGIPNLDYFSRLLERSSARLKCALVEALGKSRSVDKCDYLAGILRDEFFTVRCSAARALGELGDRRAIPCLIKAMKEDPNEDVKKEAGRSLKKLDGMK